MSTLKDHLQQVAGRDLRACFADVFGYRLLSPDQERHVEALQTQPRVSACGATGTGKTFDEGVAATVLLATSRPSKGLFGAGKLEQALGLTWLELQRALLRANERMAAVAGGRPLASSAGVAEWYPNSKTAEPDWYARCMAMSDRNNASSVQGMMHSWRVLVDLSELEAVAPEIWQKLDAGTNQDRVHFWTSFNPISRDSAAARYHDATPEAGRCHFSAIRAAEWQERTGHYVPGMPTLASIEAKWKGRESDPLYYISVLGEYPPDSAENVIVPQEWYRACVNCIPDEVPSGSVYGLDTGGGSAENVLARIYGRVVSFPFITREHHETPQLVTRVKDAMNVYGRGPIAVDYIGTGGKGVGDDLSIDGYQVCPFRGGGRDFCDRHDESGLYPDVVTWAWFTFRDAVRLTYEAIRAGRAARYVSLPDDPDLCEQLARPFGVSKERQYVMAAKPSGREREDTQPRLPVLRKSPDRADAVVMAWLCAQVAQVYSRIVTAEEAAPELAMQGESIGERW